MKKLRMFSLVVVVALFTYVSLLNNAVYALDNVGTSDGNTKVIEIAPAIYDLKQGETLVLGEGHYQISGQAYLNENNITIQGAGKDKTFIYINSANNSWGITVTGSNCTLQDFTVERSMEPNNAAVIKVMGGDNALIKNVKTIGGFYGVDINPSFNAVIDHCEFTNTSKGSIGIGSESNSQTTVLIQDTTTSNAGWMSDIVINDKDTYGNSTVTIGNGNVFKNGHFYTENYLKSNFVINNELFPQYVTVTSGNIKLYEEIPSIKLISPKDSLEVGKMMTIQGLISSANPVQEITWESLNPEIATINQKGEVTGVARGDATIRATAGSVSSEYKVTIFKVDVSVPDMDISTPSDTVNVGITDEESKDIISDTSNTIIDTIISSGTMDDSVISSSTLDNVKDALMNGLTITTKVETNPVDEKDVDVEDKNQIIESVKNLVIKDHSAAKVAQYLDINITLQSQNKSLGEIYQLDKPIAFTVAVPEDLKKEDRTFYVVRIHNGVSTILETVVNADGTISFETNLFSTYALIYDDKVESELPPVVPIEPELPEATLPEVPDASDPILSKVPEVTNPSSSNQNTISTPLKQSQEVLKTGDSYSMNQYFGWLLVSLFGIFKMTGK